MVQINRNTRIIVTGFDNSTILLTKILFCYVCLMVMTVIFECSYKFGTDMVTNQCVTVCGCRATGHLLLVAFDLIFVLWLLGGLCNSSVSRSMLGLELKEIHSTLLGYTQALFFYSQFLCFNNIDLKAHTCMSL